MSNCTNSDFYQTDQWLAVAGHQQEAALLLERTEDEQHKSGYYHTLHEILQQPRTWRHTADELVNHFPQLRETLAGIDAVILTGSGSSEYVGECVTLPLQNALTVPVETIGGGILLTHGGNAIVPCRPALMVSFARSGDSPESVGALEMLLENEPQIRHLLLTCNANGRLAITFKNHERVTVVVLDEQTNDTSLVMTSSFTNMVLAALSLCKLSDPDSYRATAESLSVLAEDLLYNRMDSIAALSRKDFKRAVFLASGPRLGAAREAALKMTEMTAGRIIAMSESYLGLRHGPMSGVHSDTLVICFLSSDPLVRAYEYDLITELNEKHLGMAKLLFGDQVPAGLALPQDLVIDCKGLAALGDDNVPILDVVVSQLLAFFKCLQEGLQPDSPSTNGIINRVVQEFKLHRPEE